MQTFEQIIDWQNRSFIDALFIDLKMLQFFKIIVPEGTIFTDAVTEEITKQSFHLRLLDMSLLIASHATLGVGCLASYIQRAII